MHATLPVRSAGALLALIVLAYLAWSAVASHDHIGKGRWLLRRPSARMALAQVGVSSLDWLITGTVLFAVLPAAAGLEYGPLMRTYLVAQTAGMASHVPGGAGVFEAVMITLAATGAGEQRAALIAGLVMFRVVYYLLPLMVALVTAGVTELLPRRRAARLMADSRMAHVP
jgi:phosphatidylglycerol lysyltransferase